MFRIFLTVDQSLKDKSFDEKNAPIGWMDFLFLQFIEYHSLDPFNYYMRNRKINKQVQVKGPV